MSSICVNSWIQKENKWKPFCISSFHQFSSVQLVSRVRLFATQWTTACQAFQSITNSRSLLRLISIESMMPSNHLILCHPLLLLPSIFPSNRVFSNKSCLHIRWPKYWSFSFNISLSFLLFFHFMVFFKFSFEYKVVPNSQLPNSQCLTKKTIRY